MRAHMVLPSLGVVYLLAVVTVAVVWGVRPAIVVAVLSLLAYDYLFVPPEFSIPPADPQNWPALPVFLIAAVIGSEFAAHARRLRRQAVASEALARSDTTKTAILRTVSHDLRSPLMAILTAAGALASPGFVTDDADRADLLATVLEESRRLDRLVTNLLDLSRLEAGAAEPLAITILADELVADALNSMPTASGRVRVGRDDRAVAVADAHHVQRILVNLIENALKYSPPGEPVRITVVPTAADVLIRVADHGPGVPPEEAAMIFEAFQRGADAGHIRGAGLGLAIAAGFAEVNGGRLWVEPGEERGAVFVLALPTGATR
jgi:two-component system, OmpR family, sensor histidine kinase KdpD